MSLSAPASFWVQRGLIDLMNKDTFVSLMKMSKEDIDNRIKLVDKALENHAKATGLLDGKLWDDMPTCVKYYREMLMLFQNEPPQIDVPKNDRLGLGMDGGLRSFIG